MIQKIIFSQTLKVSLSCLCSNDHLRHHDHHHHRDRDAEFLLASNSNNNRMTKLNLFKRITFQVRNKDEV